MITKHISEVEVLEIGDTGGACLLQQIMSGIPIPSLYITIRVIKPVHTPRG